MGHGESVQLRKTTRTCFTRDSPDWFFKFVTYIIFPTKDYTNLKMKNQSPCLYLMLLENFLNLNYEVNQIPPGFKLFEYYFNDVKG